MRAVLSSLTPAPQWGGGTLTRTEEEEDDDPKAKEKGSRLLFKRFACSVKEKRGAAQKMG